MTPPDLPDGTRAKPKTRAKTGTSWHKPWLVAYEKHGTVAGACKVVKVSRETAYQHRFRYPAFAAAWDKLENAVTDLLEKTVVEIALDHSRGHDQVRALEFVLKARRPAIYRESLKVTHGGKVTHEVEEKVNDEINAALAEIERLGDRLADVGPDGEAATSGRDQLAQVAG